MAAETHLLVRDGDEALLGKLPQRVQVRPHVQLAAHQHDLGVGAELLGLPLPLQRRQEREGARLYERLRLVLTARRGAEVGMTKAGAQLDAPKALRMPCTAPGVPPVGVHQGCPL